MSDERENQELQLLQMNEYIILVTLTVLYREAQLNFTPEIKLFYKLFDRSLSIFTSGLALAHRSSGGAVASPPPCVI